jgi:transcriptional regulator with XRE-family HTH domain
MLQITVKWKYYMRERREGALDSRDAEIGRRLREARELHKFTQEIIAKRIGVNRATLAKWESGKIAVDAKTLKSLAEIYGFTPDFFLSDEETKEYDASSGKIRVTIDPVKAVKAEQIKEHLRQIEKLLVELMEKKG